MNAGHLDAIANGSVGSSQDLGNAHEGAACLVSECGTADALAERGLLQMRELLASPAACS